MQGLMKSRIRFLKIARLSKFLILESYFLEDRKTGTASTLIDLEGNFSFCKHGWKIVPRGLEIDPSQICNIQVLKISWPWALFGLMSLIIFKISYVENSTVKSDWHLFELRTEEILLLLLTREHCFVKNSLKSSIFSLKSMTNLPLCKRWNTRCLFII